MSMGAWLGRMDGLTDSRVWMMDMNTARQVPTEQEQLRARQVRHRHFLHFPLIAAFMKAEPPKLEKPPPKSTGLTLLPCYVYLPMSQQITSAQITKLEELWKDQPDATLQGPSLTYHVHVNQPINHRSIPVPSRPVQKRGWGLWSIGLHGSVLFF